jgi:hypothetical protein
MNFFSSLAILFDLHFYSKIRTAHLTQFAANAVLRTGNYRIVPVLLIKHLFGAQCRADSALFAKLISDDNVKFPFHGIPPNMT